MATVREQTYNKAKEVLFSDKIKSPTIVKEVLASEIEYILKQYFEMQPNSYKAYINAQKDGSLDLEFSFKAIRVLMKNQTYTN